MTAKRAQHKATIAYPAKLIVNGQLVRNELPRWEEVLRGDGGDNGHSERRGELSNPSGYQQRPPLPTLQEFIDAAPRSDNIPKTNTAVAEVRNNEQSLPSVLTPGTPLITKAPEKNKQSKSQKASTGSVVVTANEVTNTEPVVSRPTESVVVEVNARPTTKTESVAMSITSVIDSRNAYTNMAPLQGTSACKPVYTNVHDLKSRAGARPKDMYYPQCDVNDIDANVSMSELNESLPEAISTAMNLTMTHE
jgi:hypothetical protein